MCETRVIFGNDWTQAWYVLLKFSSSCLKGHTLDCIIYVMSLNVFDPIIYNNNPCQPYPAALVNHVIKNIASKKCITKPISPMKCKTNASYEMTLFTLRTKNSLYWLTKKCSTIKWDPKLPCHEVALILYNMQCLWNENVNIYWLYEMRS